MNKFSQNSFIISRNSGFTLIEVMVATVILISSIAVMSMVYRGAFISSKKANEYVKITGYLPSVLASVRYDIRQQGNSELSQLNNNGDAWDVTYKWQANLIDFQSAPEKFDDESASFITPAKKYKLWQVDLTLQRDTLTKHYSFKELSWNNE